MALRALLIISCVMGVSALHPVHKDMLKDMKMEHSGVMLDFSHLNPHDPISFIQYMDSFETKIHPSASQPFSFLQHDWEEVGNPEEDEEVRFWEEMEPERAEQESVKVEEEHRHQRFDENYFNNFKKMHKAHAHRHHEHKHKAFPRQIKGFLNHQHEF